jgi:hypothetical protein
MKLGQFNSADWAMIRPQLLWFGAAMLLAGGLLLSAQAFVFFAEREQAAQAVKVNEINVAAQQAQQQWQSVQQYQQQYRQLHAMGVLGREHRLDWLEGLAQLQQSHPEWLLDYSFAPQRLKEGAQPEADLVLLASEMKVNWRARTEWDLSQFAAWLAEQKGRAVATECQLRRGEPPIGGIEVMCKYDWLTIAEQGKS